MIKSLKKKFILISVFTTTFVIALVFFIINIIYYTNITNQNDEVLNKIKNDDNILINLLEEYSVNSKKGILSTDKLFFNAVFVAELDENKNIIHIYNRGNLLEAKNSQLVVEKAISRKHDKGYVDYYKYTYATKSYGNFVIFVDCERELVMFFDFLKNSIIIALIIIGAVSILVTVLSQKIIAPIEENYQKQKQFITDASHELKTPLTIIGSNADVLEMENGKSKWISNIHNQIERLTHLINSLVAFSRVEERDSIEKTQFSMTDLVKSRVEDFEEMASFNFKEIEATIEEDVYYVGEEQTIVQVIDILLDNAIKYADKDSKISLSLYNTKKFVYLFVKNNAQGVKQGDLSKVFDRFYRLDESRNSKIKGYGIGLSLANLIVKKHNSYAFAYAPKDNEFVVEIRFNKNGKR
ncbi:HAMP domain-containing histidine kinase [Gemella sp. GH3]|uniref:sensor histidine kinase n=1 Tax=unclassified Gemella TaxID=2624949 RepID=UPI0015D00642|nr:MULTISPECIES: HAMP domain-containing sensor histidine kinase [unclassified Gemella]MBF0714217.1 HAMP domain-containing histidine kinase [Gemella sp. GH3.1]NYS51169.1 HAMP domain-containing histidine kinase [Gemella sp. GH3]